MNDYILIQFADTLLYLAPGFPLDAAGVVWLIKTKGIDSMTKIADNYDPELLESVDLLINLGKGVKLDGKR